MPSFLRLGSWNIVMFVTYEQIKRGVTMAQRYWESPFWTSMTACFFRYDCTDTAPWPSPHCRRDLWLEKEDCKWRCQRELQIFSGPLVTLPASLRGGFPASWTCSSLISSNNMTVVPEWLHGLTLISCFVLISTRLPVLGIFMFTWMNYNVNILWKDQTLIVVWWY